MSAHSPTAVDRWRALSAEHKMRVLDTLARTRQTIDESDPMHAVYAIARDVLIDAQDTWRAP